MCEEIEKEEFGRTLKPLTFCDIDSHKQRINRGLIYYRTAISENKIQIHEIDVVVSDATILLTDI